MKKIKFTGQLIIFIFISILIAACGPAPNSSGQTEGAEGGSQTTESGLEYIEIEEGTGIQPQPGDIVSVHYTGTLEDGTPFDSSIERGTPFQFPLGQGQVIQGWDEGIALMKEGGKAQLVIPPELGYGAGGSGPIPPNATLIFDVELVEVIPAPKPMEIDEDDYSETDSGLKYYVIEEGSGESPQMGDQVSLHYSLWLGDGNYLGSSVDQGVPLEFILGTEGFAPPGLEEGIMLMQPGGQVQIVIPPELGFSEETGGPLLANTTVIFELELLDVVGAE